MDKIANGYITILYQYKFKETFSSSLSDEEIKALIREKATDKLDEKVKLNSPLGIDANITIREVK